MMNMSSFQRLVRQLSTLTVFACSFVKTIVNNNMPSHDKPLNIIELSVYFQFTFSFLEVLCPFDLARAVLQQLNGSKCIELVCTPKWKLDGVF